MTGAPCREFRCGQSVAPTDERRTFTLASGNIHVLGILNAGERAISCDGFGALDLRVSDPKRIRAVIAAEDGATWELEVSQSIALRVRPGPYEVTLEAPHYIRYRTRVVVGKDPIHVVARLKPLPILSGTVLSRAEGRPIGGALIKSDAESVAIADATGRFGLEADPEKWPAKIVVSAAGYADSTVIPPRARASASLDDIRLGIAGSIVVEVTGAVAARVELQKRVKHRFAGVTFRSLVSAPFAFDEVEAGEYIVLVSGAEPSQRYGELVVLKEGEARSLRVDIEPFRLRVRATRAEKPIANAAITLGNRDALWEAKLSTDEAGEDDIEVWQGGNVEAAILSAPVMTALHIEQRTLAEGEDAEWFIDVPAREIVGVVVDAATGTAVPNAALALMMHGATEHRGLGVKTKADEQGRFRFSPVMHGTHILKAGARDFIPGEMTYEFFEPEQSRSVTIKLAAAAKMRLAVTDSRGAPIAGARVLPFHGNTMSGFAHTDASGMVDIDVPQGVTRDVYVIPRDGSFGFIQLRADAANASVRIPDGTSRIIVRTQSESREPIPDLGAVIRYNMRVLPFEVIRALETLQGARVRSGPDGRIVLDHMPPGAYEFWPVGSPQELELLASEVGAKAAPVRLMATPGEHTVVLTFARAEKP